MRAVQAFRSPGGTGSDAQGRLGVWCSVCRHRSRIPLPTRAIAETPSLHDQVFAERTRAGTRRFYEAGARAYEYYGDRLRQLGGPSDTVLEYGCGPGTRAFELADRGAVVHGIDISPVAIELARSEANRRGVSDRTTFSVMNAEALEFTPGTFDLVCGTSIIHHLDVSRRA